MINRLSVTIPAHRQPSSPEGPRLALTCRSWRLALKTLGTDSVFALLFEWRTNQFSERESATVFLVSSCPTSSTLPLTCYWVYPSSDCREGPRPIFAENGPRSSVGQQPKLVRFRPISAPNPRTMQDRACARARAHARDALWYSEGASYYLFEF